MSIRYVSVSPAYSQLNTMSKIAHVSTYLHLYMCEYADNAGGRPRVMDVSCKKGRNRGRAK